MILLPFFVAPFIRNDISGIEGSYSFLYKIGLSYSSKLEIIRNFFPKKIISKTSLYFTIITQYIYLLNKKSYLTLIIDSWKVDETYIKVKGQWM